MRTLAKGGGRDARPPWAIALLVLLLASCFRYEEVWSGVEIFDRGGRVRLAADSGFCGCVTLANKTDRPVLLHARLDGSLTGSAALQPRERITVRFDWAGDTTKHAYVIEAFNSDGRRARLVDVVEVGEHSSWRNCEAPGCDWGSLRMRVATMGQHR